MLRLEVAAPRMRPLGSIGELRVPDGGPRDCADPRRRCDFRLAVLPAAATPLGPRCARHPALSHIR